MVGGVIANRVSGVYFALLTFGMAQIGGKVVYNTRALGASDGLIGVPVVDVDLGVLSFSSASPGDHAAKSHEKKLLVMIVFGSARTRWIMARHSSALIKRPLPPPM